MFIDVQQMKAQTLYIVQLMKVQVPKCFTTKMCQSATVFQLNFSTWIYMISHSIPIQTQGVTLTHSFILKHLRSFGSIPQATTVKLTSVYLSFCVQVKEAIMKCSGHLLSSFTSFVGNLFCFGSKDDE